MTLILIKQNTFMSTLHQCVGATRRGHSVVCAAEAMTSIDLPINFFLPCPISGSTLPFVFMVLLCICTVCLCLL